MTKVRLLKLVTGSMGLWQKDEEREVENSFALALIQAGAAEPVEIETPEAAPEPETAVIKTKRGKHK